MAGWAQIRYEFRLTIRTRRAAEGALVIAQFGTLVLFVAWHQGRRDVKRSIHTWSCQLCGQRESKSVMIRHLKTCAVAHDRQGVSQALITLEFEAHGDPRYWVQLEVRANAQLQAVDSVLRELWLECCGHMSAFSGGGGELSMHSAVGDILGARGRKLRYEYDFGSTTTLYGRVLDMRRGSLGRSAVRLLARNDAPAWTCVQCENPASIVCPFCAEYGVGVYCPGHAKKHEHAAEGVFLPVVNSPRMGVCGYSGQG